MTGKETASTGLQIKHTSEIILGPLKIEESSQKAISNDPKATETEDTWTIPQRLNKGNLPSNLGFQSFRVKAPTGTGREHSKSDTLEEDDEVETNDVSLHSSTPKRISQKRNQSSRADSSAVYDMFRTASFKGSTVKKSFRLKKNGDIYHCCYTDASEIWSCGILDKKLNHY